MQPLKALLVEDNRFMATVLQDMLQQYAERISVLGIAHSGKDALQLMESTQPDVVFLDIELPDMTGFELLNQVSTLSFKTIFTTAHSHYAIKAFRFNALDYLVKPIKEDELKEAIKRLGNSKDDSEEIKVALSNLKATSVDDHKLLLPTQQGTLRLLLKQMVYLEGERNYSYIHLVNGKKVLSSKNLAYFEDILEDKGFFRCHRSFLVNHNHVTAVTNDAFILKNQLEIPIARRKKVAAHNWFI